MEHPHNLGLGAGLCLLIGPPPSTALLGNPPHHHRRHPHRGCGSVLTSCDRKGMIWAKIVFSLLAISVWKEKEEEETAGVSTEGAPAACTRLPSTSPCVPSQPFTCVPVPSRPHKRKRQLPKEAMKLPSCILCGHQSRDTAPLPGCFDPLPIMGGFDPFAIAGPSATGHPQQCRTSLNFPGPQETEPGPNTAPHP